MATLVQRYEDLLGRVVHELHDLYGARLVAVAVYGSVGRGTMREDSDIELRVVARGLGGRPERWREFDAVATPEEVELEKCRTRLKALAVLRDDGDHSDVVREAQELVERALKARLRAVGVDPPKQHDVEALLIERSRLFPADVREHLPRAAEISKSLRKDRELAFYGEVDFIPTVEYTEAQGREAYDGAAWVFELARKAVTERRA